MRKIVSNEQRWHPSLKAGKMAHWLVALFQPGSINCGQTMGCISEALRFNACSKCGNPCWPRALFACLESRRHGSIVGIALQSATAADISWCGQAHSRIRRQARNPGGHTMQNMQHVLPVHGVRAAEARVVGRVSRVLQVVSLPVMDAAA